MASKELTELRNKNHLLQMRLARLREDENERAEIANLRRWIQDAETEIAKFAVQGDEAGKGER